MKDNSNLTKALQECISACEYCADACLNEDDISPLVDCIRLDRNCADICATTLRLIVRNSNFSGSTVDLCADICAACAEECEKHDHDHCKQCAEACRRCEKQCREYSSMAPSM